MSHVYILRSDRDGNFYVGSTRDLEQRIKRHMEGRVPATKNWLPLVMVYNKFFKTYCEAYDWERFIKKQKSSEYINKLISEQ